MLFSARREIILKVCSRFNRLPVKTRTSIALRNWSPNGARNAKWSLISGTETETSSTSILDAFFEAGL